ncbi:hypothetical protein RB195_003091 [Necator americanus]|uniref:Uncharacterized protein n=1 Tax=Necator americanus TaxID=51031 RepID=A0ABR1DNG4_NECAM
MEIELPEWSMEGGVGCSQSSTRNFLQELANKYVALLFYSMYNGDAKNFVAIKALKKATTPKHSKKVELGSYSYHHNETALQ